jgi:hypothetical protein
MFSPQQTDIFSSEPMLHQTCNLKKVRHLRSTNITIVIFITCFQQAYGVVINCGGGKELSSLRGLFCIFLVGCD